MDGTKTKPLRVAVAIDTSHSNNRNILNGIIRFAKLRRDWSLEVFLGRSSETLPRALTPDDYVGAIGAFFAPAYRALYRHIEVPTIMIHPDLSRPRRPPKMPDCRYLYADNAGIAVHAADFLLKHGFRSFAYVCNTRDKLWSEERRIAFISHLSRRGHFCATFTTGGAQRIGAAALERKLAAWLKRLPPGTAILAANDQRAHQVLELCRKTGLEVPGRLAILGIDNETQLCELSSPAISSVALDCEAAGFRAAETLDLMMRGGGEDRLPPILTYSVASVITRGTTGAPLVRDPIVRRALEMIHATNGVITAADLTARLKVSPRSLENHFRSELDQSPYAEIQRVRLRRVNDLAGDPSLSAADIALRCGFASLSHLSTFYRRMTGQTFTQFRKSAHQD